MKRRLIKNKQKSEPKTKSPRLMVLVEGEMETKALPELTEAIKTKESLSLNIIKKGRIINSASASTPPKAIGKEIGRLVKFNNDKAESFLAVIDFEDRNCDVKSFKESVQAECPENCKFELAVRCSESWILCDIENLSKKYNTKKRAPSFKSSYQHLNGQDAKSKLKNIWGDYTETKKGAQLLVDICIDTVSERSNSFRSLIKTLKELDKPKKNKGNPAR